MMTNQYVINARCYKCAHRWQVALGDTIKWCPSCGHGSGMYVSEDDRKRNKRYMLGRKRK